jgi:RimJ/RimL family protein N-acetyltransferase
MPPKPVQPEGRTPRLVLRPLSIDDAEQIQALFPQWEIVRFLRDIVPWPYPPGGAIEYIRDIALPEMERGESFNWTLRLAADPDRIIGFLGLKPGESHNRGFWLDPRHQGHGLMTEACAWANDFWFDVLGQPTLRVYKAIANTASRRISLRHGMRVIGTEEANYVSGRLPSEIWELTAEEWHAQRFEKPE